MIPSAVTLSRTSTIGWIGLGAMGHHMALNLFTKTYLAYHQSHPPSSAASSSSSVANGSQQEPSFLICENDDARAETFISDLREKSGAELAARVQRVGSGNEMVQHAGRIMTMLPSTPQVESVYLDPKNGILSGIPAKADPLDVPSSSTSTSSTSSSASPFTLFSSGSSRSEVDNISSSLTSSSGPPAQPGPDPDPSSTGENAVHTLLIDGTTLDPTAAIRIAQTVQSETSGRALMMDAPVSGGIVAAEAGALTIMYGSPSPIASSIAIPLLQRMARDGGVIACGGNGTGVGVKVCNNLILAINQIGLAEGLSLGKSLGIDPVLLHSVINTSSGQSWSSKVNSPLAEVPNSPGSRGYSGGFQARLMLKDVGLALTAAHVYDLPTPLGWAAKSVYNAVCEEDGGSWASKDFSVVLEWLKRKQEQGVEKGWKDDPMEE